MKRCLIPILLLLFTVNALAASIGRDGPPYEHNGISWQPAKYQDTNAVFTVALPGKYSGSGLSSDVHWYAASTFNGVFYRMNTPVSTEEIPVQESEFISELNSKFASRATITPLAVPTTLSNVKYIAQLRFLDGKQLTQIYATNNKLYYASVYGTDFSLAEAFFATVKI